MRRVLEALTFEEAYRSRMDRVHSSAVAKGYQAPTAEQIQFAQPKGSVARLEPVD
jgi:hypothetical protein